MVANAPLVRGVEWGSPSETDTRLLPDRQADHGTGTDAEAVASPCCRLRHRG
jgi:hypothetical protein